MKNAFSKLGRATSLAWVIGCATWLHGSVEGCSGSSTSITGPDTAAMDQACSDLSQTRCAKRMSCTSSIDPEGVNIVRNYGDLATCLARDKVGCLNGQVAPGTGASVSTIMGCNAALPATSCNDFLDGDTPPACRPAGSGANGKSCAFNAQCASGYCSGTKNGICGTCTDAPASGASCATSSCDTGQVCVASTSLCQTRGASGATCDTDHPCGTGLSCAGDTATVSGTCQDAVTTVGTACGAAMPGCQGNLGLACTGASGMKTCTAITFADDGQACGALPDGSRGDCKKGDCFTATGPAGAADMGTCKALAADGAACDTLLGPSCLAPARCVVGDAGTAGVCVVPTAALCGP